jgi:hypothetical protein
MYECPQIQECFELTMDYFANTVQCKELALPETKDVLKDISKLNALQHKLQQMAFKFDSCMKQFDSWLADANARITGCEVNISEQLNHATSKFAISATKHYTTLTEYASQTFVKFQSNITDYTEQVLAMQCSKIMDMHTANNLKIQSDLWEAEKAFNDRLEQAIERIIQEILSAADDATDNINAQAEHILQQAPTTHAPESFSQGPSWKYDEPKPLKMFPNVDLTKFSSISKHQDTSEHHQQSKMSMAASDDDQAEHDTLFPLIGQFSLPNSDSTENLISLPPVSHNDMMNVFTFLIHVVNSHTFGICNLKAMLVNTGFTLLVLKILKRINCYVRPSFMASRLHMPAITI